MVKVEIVKEGYIEYTIDDNNISRACIHKTKVKCPCGAIIYLDSIKKHFKTKKHKKYNENVELIMNDNE